MLKTATKKQTINKRTLEFMNDLKNECKNVSMHFPMILYQDHHY